MGYKVLHGRLCRRGATLITASQFTNPSAITPSPSPTLDTIQESAAATTPRSCGSAAILIRQSSAVGKRWHSPSGYRTHSVVLAEKTLSEVYLCRREPVEARRLIAEWEATSSKHALPFVNTQARFQRGWALSEEGQADQGVVEMRESIAAVSATGAAMGLQHFLCILAQGYGACGMSVREWRSSRRR